MEIFRNNDDKHFISVFAFYFISCLNNIINDPVTCVNFEMHMLSFK